MPVLDSITIVAFVLLILRTVDLILKPYQEKWVQDRVETIVLWLDYKRPLAIFLHIKNPWYYFPLIALMILVTAAYIWWPSLKYFAKVLNEEPSKLLYWLGWITFGLSLGSAPLFAGDELNYIQGRKGNQLLSSSLLLRFMLRCVWSTIRIVSLWLFVNIIFCLFAMLAIRNDSLAASRIFELSLAATLPWVFAVLEIVPGCFIVVTTTTIILILHFIVATLRGLGWRLVEYRNGVVPGTILLICVIIEFYIRLLVN